MSKFSSRLLALAAVVLMVVSILSTITAFVVMFEASDAMASWHMTPQGQQWSSAWARAEYKTMPRDVAPAESMLGVCSYKPSIMPNTNTCDSAPVLAMILFGLAGLFLSISVYMSVSDKMN